MTINKAAVRPYLTEMCCKPNPILWNEEGISWL